MIILNSRSIMRSDLVLEGEKVKSSPPTFGLYRHVRRILFHLFWIFALSFDMNLNFWLPSSLTPALSCLFVAMCVTLCLAELLLRRSCLLGLFPILKLSFLPRIVVIITCLLEFIQRRWRMADIRTKSIFPHHHHYYPPRYYYGYRPPIIISKRIPNLWPNGNRPDYMALLCFRL